jgi:hypothetical protein
MKTRFYDVHVFFSRNDGYSVGVKIDSIEPLSEEQIIEFTFDTGNFTDDGDLNNVDYVKEISDVEFNLLTA